MPAKKSGSKKSTFGFSRGDTVGYSYRSAKSPKGTVTGVTPGTTRNTAKVGIAPAPKFQFGEGHITRKVSKVHHTKLTATDKKKAPRK